MIDHVVFDVEIQKTIEETPGGWDSTDQLGVSVACLWEYKTQRMRVYGPDELDDLTNRLFKADRISGFNIFNFDYPVVWGVSKGRWKELDNGSLVLPELGVGLKTTLKSKTDDILRRIWQAMSLDPDNFNPRTHAGWSLDRVATATLGVSKIGYGGDAPKWYQDGKIQKVANYCADDVALERDLCDFIDKYGYVLNLMNGGVKRLEIPEWKGGS